MSWEDELGDAIYGLEEVKKIIFGDNDEWDLKLINKTIKHLEYSSGLVNALLDDAIKIKVKLKYKSEKNLLGGDLNEKKDKSDL
jgi:hypothetical protein